MPRVKDPGSLVRFERISANYGLSRSWGVPYGAAQLIRTRSTTLSAVLMEATTFDAAWGIDGEEPLNAAYVSANWFTELGYGAERGRVFVQQIDENPSAQPVAVVSHRFWSTRLQRDPNIAGRTIWVNKQPALVIGVAQRDFPGLRLADTEVWLLISQLDYFVPGSAFREYGAVELYGRLRPNASSPAAKKESQTILAGLAKERPDVYRKGEWLEPYPGSAGFVPPEQRRQTRLMVLRLGGLSLLILLIACANLSNLVLSRAMERVREFGVRAALGASPWRVARQLVIEGAVLAGLGSLGGLVAGDWGVRLLSTQMGLPGYLDFSPDLRTILAAFIGAAVAISVAGLLPAWKLSRTDLTGVIKDGGQYVSDSLQRASLRQALVAVQVAGSCLLLVLAGLTARGLVGMFTQGGFEFDSVAVLEAPLALSKIKGDVAQRYWAQVRRSIASHPETDSTAMVSLAPLGDSNAETTYRSVPGLRVTSLRVELAFFSLMKIPILLGRAFDVSDDPQATVIISQRLAMEMYGTVDVLGNTFPKGL